MSWLFWILFIMVVSFMIQGFRKGLVRTAVSMISFLVVMVAVWWLNPYVGDFIQEKTDWQEKMQEKCSEILFQGLEDQFDLSVTSQVVFIEELPLPQTMKEKLLENNNTEMYRHLAVENFADYLSGYLARGIINGIAFLVSFVIAMVLIRIILCAVDILTELPGLGFLNRMGGLLLGGVQGTLWVWIIFLAVTILYDTTAGGYLMGVIREDPILTWIYDGNYLVNMIMGILV